MAGLKHPIGTKLEYTAEFKERLRNERGFSSECYDVLKLPYVTVKGAIAVGYSLMEFHETGGRWGADAFQVYVEPVHFADDLFKI